MKTLSDYYKNKAKTFANSPSIEVTGGLGVQHFPHEGLYVGQLEIDRNFVMPALIDLQLTNGVCFLYKSANEGKQVNLLLERLCWRLALTVPSRLCDFIVYGGDVMARNLVSIEKLPQVFFGDRNHFVDQEAKRFKLDEIVTFCQERGLAFFDTSTAVRRLKDNASDKFLEVVEPTDIRALLGRLPHCRTIVTTGEKATETICATMHIPVVPKVNTSVAIPDTYNRDGQQILLYRLPSSSRAYPMSFDQKTAAYRRMFEEVGLSVDRQI